MGDKHVNISNEDWVRILRDIMNESRAFNLLDIPDVYEAVSEHFNNDIIAAWEAEQDPVDEDDEEES